MRSPVASPWIAVVGRLGRAYRPLVVQCPALAYLFIIKSYTEYNKQIKNEHRKHTEKKLKNKNTRIVTKHTIKH